MSQGAELRDSGRGTGKKEKPIQGCIMKLATLEGDRARLCRALPRRFVSVSPNCALGFGKGEEFTIFYPDWSRWPIGANSGTLLVLPVQSQECSHGCPTSKPWGRKLEVRVEDDNMLSYFTCGQ